MANLFEEKRQKLVEQIARILPLIETERQAYIHAEGGRLAAIIGTGYWNKEIEDFEIFHGRKGDDPVSYTHLTNILWKKTSLTRTWNN